MDTRAQIKSWLSKAVVTGLSGTNLTNVQEAAIDWAVEEGYPEYQDLAYLDIIANGVTTEWTLTGNDITILETEDQIQPPAPNTAGVAAPSSAPVPTQSNTVSTIKAGTRFAAIQHVTSLGRSPLSAVGSVVLAAAKSITFPAYTPPTTGLPITAVVDWVSREANDPVLVNAGTRTAVAGVCAAATYDFSALGVGNAPQTYATAFSDWDWLLERNAAGLIPQSVPNTSFGFDFTDGSAVIATNTAPTAGQQMRVWYWRRSAVPTQDSDLIRQDPAYLRLGTLIKYLTLLAASSSSGDVDTYTAAAGRYQQELDLKRSSAERPVPQRGMQSRTLF